MEMPFISRLRLERVERRRALLDRNQRWASILTSEQRECDVDTGWRSSFSRAAGGFDKRICQWDARESRESWALDPSSPMENRRSGEPAQSD